MIGLDSPQIRSRLVGVIDLQHGHAVHAVAGQRASYRPVAFCDGDPVGLAEHYLRLGLRELYLADLDAIGGGELATDTICRIADMNPVDRLLIDVGWSGNEPQRVIDQIGALSDQYRSIHWIAATESMRSRAALDRIAQQITPTRLFLGLDFRSGVPLSGVDGVHWDDVAEQLGFAGAVILDLASVGQSRGPATQSLCRSIRQRFPDWTLFSGGGVRGAADVRSLMDAGCDRCLVATALHGIL